MSTPMQRVRAARSYVQSAIDMSRGASLADLTRTSDHLRSALGTLQSIEQEYRDSGIPDANGRFRAEIAQLRRDMAAAGRIIDGGAALYRGLALRLAGTASAYSPRAAAPSHSAVAPSMVIEG